MLRKYVENLLASAGIRLNGSDPWDIRINDNRVFLRVLRGGLLAIGESYVDGDWDCDRLDLMVERLLLHDFQDQFQLIPLPIQKAISKLADSYYNHPESAITAENRDQTLAETHYDKVNDLLQRFMLGKYLLYSCGHFKDTDDNDEAQLAKCRLTCEKLGLVPGMHCLELGGGLGELAFYACDNYGVSVVIYTISSEQAAFIEKHKGDRPIEVRLESYKNLRGSGELFDAVWSIEMFEAVPPEDHLIFIQTVYEVLRELGPFLLQTSERNPGASTHPNPWIEKYIFPRGFMPSEPEIAAFTRQEGARDPIAEFPSYAIPPCWPDYPMGVIDHYVYPGKEHGAFLGNGFWPIDNDRWPGAYYHKTLLAWYQNCLRYKEWIIATYGLRFWRMLEYYLLTCAPSYKTGRMQIRQHLFQRRLTGAPQSRWPFQGVELQPLLDYSGAMPAEMLRGKIGEFWYELMPRPFWECLASCKLPGATLPKFPKLTFRPLQESDHGTISTLLREAGMGPEFNGKLQATIGPSKGSLVLVALLPNEIQPVGVIFAIKDSQGEDHIANFTVRADAHNQFIGSLLLNELERVLFEENKVRLVTIHLPEDIPLLHSFLRKRGYKAVAPQKWVKDLAGKAVVKQTLYRDTAQGLIVLAGEHPIEHLSASQE